MSIKQESLPQLSETYYHVADSIARKILSRRVLKLSAVNINDHGLIRFEETENLSERLTPLAMLIALRDLGLIRHTKPENTRRNVVTVARVGAVAVSGLSSIAGKRNIQLSPDALRGLGHTLSVVNDKMENAFRPVARELPDDKEALYFLARAARLIG